MEQTRAIDLTAIVCTRNRCQLLQKAVNSLLRQDLSPSRYEVLIVDNGSCDLTRQYAEKISLDSPGVRYVYESRVGLSFARNTGLELAIGNYVCYLDDDAVAAPGWLSSILKVFNDTSLEPPVGIACGPVIPNWEMPPPSWLRPRYWGALSIVDISSSPQFLTNQNWYPEGNSAYRRHLLQSVGGFDTKLGRSGKNLAANEGATVDLKIRSLGYGIYYDPAIYIFHFIPKNRISKKWLLMREFWQGYSYAILDLISRSRCIQDIPILLFLRVCGAFSECFKAMKFQIAAAFIKSTKRDEELFDQLLRAAMETGYCWGIIQFVAEKIFLIQHNTRVS